MTPNFIAYIYNGDISAVAKIHAGLLEIQGLLTAKPGHYFDGENVSYADYAVAPFLGRMLTFGKAGESIPALIPCELNVLTIDCRINRRRLLRKSHGEC